MKISVNVVKISVNIAKDGDNIIKNNINIKGRIKKMFCKLISYSDLNQIYRMLVKNPTLVLDNKEITKLTWKTAVFHRNFHVCVARNKNLLALFVEDKLVKIGYSSLLYEDYLIKTDKNNVEIFINIKSNLIKHIS